MFFCSDEIVSAALIDNNTNNNDNKQKTHQKDNSQIKTIGEQINFNFNGIENRTNSKQNHQHHHPHQILKKGESCKHSKSSNKNKNVINDDTSTTTSTTTTPTINDNNIIKSEANNMPSTPPQTPTTTTTTSPILIKSSPSTSPTNTSIRTETTTTTNIEPANKRKKINHDFKKQQHFETTKSPHSKISSLFYNEKALHSEFISSKCIVHIYYKKEDDLSILIDQHFKKSFSLTSPITTIKSNCKGFSNRNNKITKASQSKTSTCRLNKTSKMSNQKHQQSNYYSFILELFLNCSFAFQIWVS
jgi:hypothetical protein